MPFWKLFNHLIKFDFVILIYMEDDYFNYKMFDEVDMDMDDTIKNENCINFFTTMEVILL